MVIRPPARRRPAVAGQGASRRPGRRFRRSPSLRQQIGVKIPRAQTLALHPAGHEQRRLGQAGRRVGFCVGAATTIVNDFAPPS